MLFLRRRELLLSFIIPKYRCGGRRCIILQNRFSPIMSFPTKEERAKCWGARDDYWHCLDENRESEAMKDGPCKQFRKLYEKSCSSQWVKHFDRKRSYLQFKEKIEKDGYEPLDSRSKE